MQEVFWRMNRLLTAKALDCVYPVNLGQFCSFQSVRTRCCFGKISEDCGNLSNLCRLFFPLTLSLSRKCFPLELSKGTAVHSIKIGFQKCD